MSGALSPELTGRLNDELLQRLSRFLSDEPAYVNESMVGELAESCGIDGGTAYSLLLAAALGLDIDENPLHRALYRDYFPHMLRRLDPAEYTNNPYRTAIRFPAVSDGAWTLKYDAYKPYEAFVRDDIAALPDGRVIPQIGYFDRAFTYPAVYENGRVWMSVTPNEINTMSEPARRAHGSVLTLGLGMGYFAYIASERAEVESVTIVEQSQRVIALFNKHILPQFTHADKVRVIHSDAFKFAQTHYGHANYDFIFADLWHDVSDGLPMYLRLKKLERLDPSAEYAYWIEKTMRLYLPD